MLNKLFVNNCCCEGNGSIAVIGDGSVAEAAACNVNINVVSIVNYLGMQSLNGSVAAEGVRNRYSRYR